MTMTKPGSVLDLPKLGVNIDHVATLRQLRHTPYPNLVKCAEMVALAGAHQITIHLREDRRHIQDKDLWDLVKHSPLPLNLEMAATPSMVKIAKKAKPAWVCLVPEKRQEVTTEGGLELKKSFKRLLSVVREIQKSKIKVSLFVEPSLESVKFSKQLGADAIEIHTGKFCIATQAGHKAKARTELARIVKACQAAWDLGLEVHAGHGFDDQNVRMLSGLEYKGLPLISEYNIGHFIVCRAVEVGLERSVREMVSAICAP